MIIPFVVLAIVFYGISENVDVYDEFVKGARRGLSTVIKIMPTLIGLMTAVGILRASGILDLLSSVLGKFTAYIGYPSELVPLAIVKMFSSSAATGIL